MSAPIANANGILVATYTRQRFGGWIAIPGFCSCGFIPRPSTGSQSSRSYGLDPKQSVARKNIAMTASTPITYGISSRFRLLLVSTATLEKNVRISTQKSIDPACPPQNAVNRYALGRFALVNDATYLNEKSCVKIAVHKPSDANTTIANVAYVPRSALATRSWRRNEPPANATVAVQTAMSRATHSDNSPTRIIVRKCGARSLPRRRHVWMRAGRSGAFSYRDAHFARSVVA